MRPETTRFDDRDELANRLDACDGRLGVFPGFADGTGVIVEVGDAARSWLASGGARR